jgi:primosomal protein N'
MDKDNVKTQKQAIKIIDKFYQTTGSILIGTEMALPYLNKKIENSAILSIDNLKKMRQRAGNHRRRVGRV